MVVFATSFMLVRGSAESGHRKMQGAKIMAKALGDMRLCASSLATLYGGGHIQTIQLQASSSTSWHTGILIISVPTSQDGR